jgi:hypothetical protein
VIVGLHQQDVRPHHSSSSVRSRHDSKNGIGRPLPRQPSRQAAAMGVVGPVAAIVGALGEWRLRTAHKPLISFNPMRPAERWQPRWIPEQADGLAEGEHLVAFLGEQCSECKPWASPLSKINARPDLPTVLGVMAVDRAAAAAYAQENGITFPVVPMKKLTYARLVEATPTIAVVKDGLIQSVDQGVLPPSLIERVKQRRAPAPGLAGMSLAGMGLAGMALAGIPLGTPAAEHSHTGHNRA